jgi:C4-dicarboxylate-specific signal transduction histidine kinase
MDNPETLIPIVAVGGFFLFLIVATLAHHQRKMAALLHGLHQQPQQAQNPDVVNELSQLRQMVAQQTITIDTLATEQAKLRGALPSDDTLRQTLRAGS